jgi:type I restriction enzyme S subunit
MSAIQQLLTEHLDIWTAADTAKKSGRGRSSANAASVYGIKKLRELILELAVRGKLVPQDTNDEPASELLKRIQAEKAKLVAEGKIKSKSPSVPLLQSGKTTASVPHFAKGGLGGISEDEEPFELPQGWAWARLGFIGYTQTGSTPSKSNSKSFGFDIPFVKPSDIYPNHVDYGNEGLSYFGAEQSGRIAPSGSLLMVCIGTIGKCNLIEIDCSFNQQINSVTPYIFDSRFLLSVCRSIYFHTEAWSRSSSTTIPILNKGNWEEICIPVPPILEQHRIVAKVDELMVLCDQLETQHNNAAEAHEKLVSHLLATLTQSQSAADFSANWQRIAAHFDTLFTTETSIDTLKQALLQLAVMGKLVPQDPKDEPASELLKRIQVEKAKLIAEGKIKKDKQLPPIDEIDKIFDLPVGWLWTRLGTVLLKITDGTHHSPPNGDVGEYLYISAKNIKQDGVQLSNATYVTKELHDEIYSRCDPEFGDILYIKDGATTGIVTINDQHDPFSMLSSVALLKCPRGIVNTYLLLALRSPYFYDEMRAGMTGVAITRVTLNKLDHAFISLPPLDEQHRIVAKVDELMALCAQLKILLTAANQMQQKLADVMVQHAVV